MSLVPVRRVTDGRVIRFDDNGFTNDLALKYQQHMHVGERTDVFSLQAGQRMITERGGDRRTDEMFSVLDTSQFVRRGALSLGLHQRLGVFASGDFGGAQLQDWAHAHLFRGRRLPSVGVIVDGSPLQHDYVQQRRFGVVVGAGIEASARLLERKLGQTGNLSLELGARADGQLAIGQTGTHALSQSAYVSAAAAPCTGVALELRAELSARLSSTSDSMLTLPGGYVNGFAAGARLSVKLRVGPVFLEAEQRLNEGGSGYHTGGATLGVVW